MGRRLCQHQPPFCMWTLVTCVLTLQATSPISVMVKAKRFCIVFISLFCISVNIIREKILILRKFISFLDCVLLLSSQISVRRHVLSLWNQEFHVFEGADLTRPAARVLLQRIRWLKLLTRTRSSWIMWQDCYFFSVGSVNTDISSNYDFIIWKWW
jgi:hypothetical protein